MFLPHFRYRRIVKALIVIVVLATFAAFIIYAKRLIDEKNSKYEETTATQAYIDLNAITINDERFIQKSDLKTILIIGLDIDGKIVSSNSYNNDYNADFLMLVTFDTVSKVCKLVEINRDSIVPVQRLDIFGQPVDKQEMQICLSYSYGDGLGESANNTELAVSDIFHGLKIDYYLVLSREATKRGVNFVGGVDITMDNDYSDINPLYVKGSTHSLNADEAMNFVTARYGTKYGTNVYRMQRQMCLVNSVVDKLKKTSFSFSDLYGVMSEYTVSDIDIAIFSNIMAEISDYTIMPVITPSGKSVVNYGYNQFYNNEESVMKIAQYVFYDKI